MNTEALKQKLGGRLNLPSLPDVIVRLQKLIGDPTCGMKDLAEELSSDPPLVARVLRIANSAFYSFSVPILDINHAAAILGLNTLHSVFTQIGVIDVFGHLRQHPEFDPRVLWNHSVVTARLALEFPPRILSATSREDAYVTGLLHDIGKFVLYDNLKKEFLEIQQLSREQGLTSQKAERDKLGFDHAEVGGMVTAHWRLPDRAVQAISDHHSRVALERGDKLTLLIAAANELAKLKEIKKSSRAARLSDVLVDSLELSEEELIALSERSLELQAEQSC